MPMLACPRRSETILRMGAYLDCRIFRIGETLPRRFNHLLQGLDCKQPDICYPSNRSIHSHNFVSVCLYCSSGGFGKELWASVESWECCSFSLCSKYSPITTSTQSAVIGHISLQYLQYRWAIWPKHSGCLTTLNLLVPIFVLSDLIHTLYWTNGLLLLQNWIYKNSLVLIIFDEIRTVCTTFFRVCQAPPFRKCVYDFFTEEMP